MLVCVRRSGTSHAKLQLGDFRCNGLGTVQERWFQGTWALSPYVSKKVMLSYTRSFIHVIVRLSSKTRQSKNDIDWYSLFGIVQDRFSEWRRRTTPCSHSGDTAWKDPRSSQERNMFVCPCRKRAHNKRISLGKDIFLRQTFFVIDEYETDPCTYIFVYFRFVDIVISHRLDVRRNRLVSCDNFRVWFTYLWNMCEIYVQ